jgi:hypothetical protein
MGRRMSDNERPREPLALALRAHYQRQRLDRDKLERLCDLADAAGESRSPAPSRASTRRIAMAAGGIVLAAAVLLAVAINERPPITEPRPELIAEEIALNHRKDLAVEFATPSYLDLSSRMNKLDFRVVEPATPVSAKLLGARYCSINGCIAAQLKVCDPKGRVHTVYQTRYKPQLACMLDRSIDVGKVRVRFWRQGEVLVGMATPR